MKDLLKFNNYLRKNKLILTTNSPNLINYLKLAVKAGQMKDTATNVQKKELDKFFPIESVVYSEELRIYEMDDKGSISLLSDCNGFPSDKNSFNEQIEEVNSTFSELIKLKDSWR